MVIALAGRRVDAPDATSAGFPSGNAPDVQEKIRKFLIDSKAGVLVCAAACGVDILALEVAGELGLRRCIVLPYDREAFKKSSVLDRPGDWGERYDRIINEVADQGDLSESDYDQDQKETYFATNHDILDQAEDIAQELNQPLSAVVIWNMQSRGEDDVTSHFLAEARQRGLPVSEIDALS